MYGSFTEGCILIVPLNDLSVFVVSENKNEWQSIKPSSTGPSARYNHSFVYIESLNKLLLFGGFDGKEVKNDLWLLTPGTWEWQQITTSSWCNFKEYAYALVGDRLFIFGGKEKTGVVFIDIGDNFKWKRFSGTEDDMGPVFGFEEHSKFGGVGSGAGVATVVGDTTIYLIGGRFLGNAIWSLETNKLLDIHIVDLDLSKIAGAASALTNKVAGAGAGAGAAAASAVGSGSAAGETKANQDKERMEREAREKVDRERIQKEKIEREKAEREAADKVRAEKEKADRGASADLEAKDKEKSERERLSKLEQERIERKHRKE